MSDALAAIIVDLRQMKDWLDKAIPAEKLLAAQNDRIGQVALGYYHRGRMEGFQTAHAGVEHLLRKFGP